MKEEHKHIKDSDAGQTTPGLQELHDKADYNDFIIRYRHYIAFAEPTFLEWKSQRDMLKCQQLGEG